MNRLTLSQKPVRLVCNCAVIVHCALCVTALTFTVPPLSASLADMSSRLAVLRNHFASLALPPQLLHEDVSALNIAVFGPGGAGKSTFVNHCASILAGRYLRATPVGVATRTLRKVFVSGSSNGANEVLRLWDTPGWDGEMVRSCYDWIGM